MLFRIQSLYLLLIAMLAVGSMALPFWLFQAATPIFFGDFSQFPQAGFLVSAGSIAGGIFSPLTGITAFTAILVYKNRQLQRRIIMLMAILVAGDIVSGLTAAHFLNQYFLSEATIVSHQPATGFYMLLPEPVLLWLASKAVQKDDKIATAYRRL